jgi:RNA polymerase sigma-70 factor (ECF subfamily)
MEKIEKQTERKAVNFMITITKNSAIDIYNKRTGNLIEDTSIDEIADNELEGIYMDIGINEIKEAVKMLSDDYVKVLLLKFTYGYSIKEIAKFLYVSEANVGTRIYRAKNSIKKFILNIKNR